MAHWSENSNRLERRTTPITGLSQLKGMDGHSTPAVWFFWLPAGRTNRDAAQATDAFEGLADFCSGLHNDSTVCILTTPPDAARLLPYLESILQFQLWIAVKIDPTVYPVEEGALLARHAALLMFTRYGGSLRHTKTRIQYTYCPACGKTTKDYGGKKHVYHEYGTLMSDVWRDIECNPSTDVETIIDRLRDVFGLDGYRVLHTLDMRNCHELIPKTSSVKVSEARLPFESRPNVLPVESKLINADCLEALKTIPDNSVDFCFADPPYNLQKKYDHWNDALESVEYFRWCDRWLAELGRVLKPGRTLAVLNIPLWAVRHYQFLSSVLSFQSWIAWEALGFPVRLIMPAHYAIVCFSKGEPISLPGLSTADVSMQDRTAITPLAEFFCLRSSCVSRRQRQGLDDRGQISDLWSDIHRLKHNSRRVDHPCQLPPELMRRLVALFTRPGEVVLDCFNGAGTTTLVAHQMSRRFIGIEVSPEYHKIALERHEQITSGRDPFAKRDGVPNAKNSPVDRLPKQKYVVSKKRLQLEVKRIAHQIGHLPSRQEVEAHSKYPMEYYDRYFISWGEVCAAARTTGMSELPGTLQEADAQLCLPLDGQE